MVLTSSSIERWCSAARTLRRVFKASSRLRIVILAIGRASLWCRICPSDWMLALQASLHDSVGLTLGSRTVAYSRFDKKPAEVAVSSVRRFSLQGFVQNGHAAIVTSAAGFRGARPAGWQTQWPTCSSESMGCGARFLLRPTAIGLPVPLGRSLEPIPYSSGRPFSETAAGARPGCSTTKSWDRLGCASTGCARFPGPIAGRLRWASRSVGELCKSRDGTTTTRWSPGKPGAYMPDRTSLGYRSSDPCRALRAGRECRQRGPRGS